MLKHMVEKGQDGNYDVKVMYDIGCLLAKHLQVTITIYHWSLTDLWNGICNIKSMWQSFCATTYSTAIQ